MTPTVAVCIVTYHSADDLPGCFAALAAQEHRDFEVVVVDCASADGSVAAAREADLGSIAKTVVALEENRGFAGGMNEAFRRTAAPYLLTLNPGARPRKDFLGVLLERFRARSSLRLGAVTPRLVRPGEPRRLDACGMYLVPAWRHLDRGSGEVDRGQYAAAKRVFGGTGAATLWSRAALDDVAVGGEVFDPAFHSFREDAELCFRLQERGWEVVYEPAAIAENRRRVLPERRRDLPSAVNYHSLKNRYLLRAYHQTPRNFVRTFFPALVRDLGALAYVLLFERASLAAYAWLWRHRREVRERRRLVQGPRTAPPERLELWFRRRALPLETTATSRLRALKRALDPRRMMAAGRRLAAALKQEILAVWRGMVERGKRRVSELRDLASELPTAWLQIPPLRRLDHLPPTLALILGVALGGLGGFGLVAGHPVLGTVACVTLLAGAGVLVWSGQPVAVIEVVEPSMADLTTPEEEVELAPSSVSQVPRPFVAGPVLRPVDQELFRGRANIVEGILSDLSSARRDTIVLVGQRRMGKSSLLNLLPTQLGAGTKTVRLDFQRLSGSLHRAWPHLWVAQEVAEVWPNAPTMPVTEAWDETLAWLADIDASLKASDVRLLVALDDVERLEDGIRDGWTTTDFLDFLRAAGDAFERIRFLLSTSFSLNRLGPHWVDALINVRRYRLGRLSPADAESLIRKPEADFPDIYPPGGVEHIIEATAGHPFLIQLVCDLLCRNLNEFVRLKATPDDIEVAIDAAIKEGHFLFFELWRYLPVREQRLLTRLVDGRESMDDEGIILRGLKEEGYVVERDGRPVVTVPMFVDWIADNV